MLERKGEKKRRNVILCVAVGVNSWVGHAAIPSVQEGFVFEVQRSGSGGRHRLGQTHDNIVTHSAATNDRASQCNRRRCAENKETERLEEELHGSGFPSRSKNIRRE